MSAECVDTFFGIASAKPQTAVDSPECSEASGRAGAGLLSLRLGPAGEQSCGLGLLWAFLGSQGALSVFCVWDISKCIYKKKKQNKKKSWMTVKGMGMGAEV